MEVDGGGVFLIFHCSYSLGGKALLADPSLYGPSKSSSGGNWSCPSSNANQRSHLGS